MFSKMFSRLLFVFMSLVLCGMSVTASECPPSEEFPIAIQEQTLVSFASYEGDNVLEDYQNLFSDPLLTPETASSWTQIGEPVQTPPLAYCVPHELDCSTFEHPPIQQVVYTPTVESALSCDVKDCIKQFLDQDSVKGGPLYSALYALAPEYCHDITQPQFSILHKILSNLNTKNDLQETDLKPLWAAFSYTQSRAKNWLQSTLTKIMAEFNGAGQSRVFKHRSSNLQGRFLHRNELCPAYAVQTVILRPQPASTIYYLAWQMAPAFQRRQNRSSIKS